MKLYFLASVRDDGTLLPVKTGRNGTPFASVNLASAKRMRSYDERLCSGRHDVIYECDTDTNQMRRVDV